MALLHIAVDFESGGPHDDRRLMRAIYETVRDLLTPDDRYRAHSIFVDSSPDPAAILDRTGGPAGAHGEARSAAHRCRAHAAVRRS